MHTRQKTCKMKTTACIELDCFGQFEVSKGSHTQQFHLHPNKQHFFEPAVLITTIAMTVLLAVNIAVFVSQWFKPML